MGSGVELLTAVMRRYHQVTGRQLSPARVMAWHLRQALGDVLWRSEAGLPLADHRTPPQWVEDLDARFSALGIAPEARPRLYPDRAGLVQSRRGMSASTIAAARRWARGRRGTSIL